MDRTQLIALLTENYVFMLNNHGHLDKTMNCDENELLAVSKANLESALRMKTEELYTDCIDSFSEHVCDLEQYRHRQPEHHTLKDDHNTNLDSNCGYDHHPPESGCPAAGQQCRLRGRLSDLATTGSPTDPQNNDTPVAGQQCRSC